MWIIQEPKKVALWNKRHFEEGKNGEYAACLKYSVRIFIEEIYKMQHLEVSDAVRHIYIYIYVIRRLRVINFGSRWSALSRLVTKMLLLCLFYWWRNRVPLSVISNNEEINLFLHSTWREFVLRSQFTSDGRCVYNPDS